jgi:hypothetical protein
MMCEVGGSCVDLMGVKDKKRNGGVVESGERRMVGEMGGRCICGMHAWTRFSEVLITHCAFLIFMSTYSGRHSCYGADRAVFPALLHHAMNKI